MSDLTSFSAFALPGIPFVKPGDDLVRLILDGYDQAQKPITAGDVIVISSKILSKSEGRIINLNDVTPGEQALHYAEITGKDPRLAELVLQESTAVSRAVRGVMVVVHRLGFVSANAGIDQSNVGMTPDDVLLLPLNPDHSAQVIRQRLCEVAGGDVAVIISDTHGRPFRMGNVGVAIGVAGMNALLDMRGEHDLFGRELAITVQGYVDLVASAAHLLCGEGAEGRPVVVLRGLDYPAGEGNSTDLNRPPERDLYR